MPSALDLSLKHGIPIDKIRALAIDGLQFYDSPVDPDESFQRAAYEIRYGRIAAFSIAYVLRLRRDPVSDDDDARLCALTEYAAKDYGEMIDARCEAVGAPWGDLLPDAARLLDSIALGKAKGIEHLANWTRDCLDRAPGEVGHDYLATRLLLSVPEAAMLDYPKVIQTAFNRLKHSGQIADYWRKAVDKSGKTKTIYHAAINSLDL